MTALIPLHFDQADVRMVMRKGEPWWVLNDVCAILDIANPRHAATRLRDWQKGVAISDTLGGRQEMIVVNEAGIYKLVLGSRKAVAEEFERWLTCDVIPSIRKFGSYPPPEITPSLPILDESPWEGIETKTVGQRFCQERLRWEAENKRSFADVPSFSKRIIMAIEDDMGGATKGNRLHIMTVAGLDTLYILTGRRTMTEPERALRDTYRNAEPQRRQAMIAQIGATLHLGRSGADDPA